MSCSADFAPRLRELGFRVTGQRLAILHVLINSGSHLSPSEVFARARRGARGLTRPTVYRTLEFLSRNGMARASLDSQKHVVYQIPQKEHHHLVCKNCGANVEIPDASVRRLYGRLAERSGYRLTDGHLTLFGLCPACQRRAGAH